MPCDDITEVIDLRFDEDDRLRTYSLTKRTCGAEIGQASLLIDLLVRRTPEEVLALRGEDVRERYDLNDEVEFLYYKHLVGAQEAMKVMLGVESGAPGSPCTVANVGYQHGITLQAYLEIEALTEKIDACGNCGSCGSRDKPAVSGLPVVN